MCYKANEDGNYNSRQCGSCVGQSHQSASKIGCDVNVIREEAREHGAHGNNAHGHNGDGLIMTTANVAKDEQADARNDGTNRGGRFLATVVLIFPVKSNVK